MDIIVIIHMTHNLCLYINVDLDPIQKLFEMVDDYKIQTQSVSIIILKTLLDNESAFVYLQNVHYCSEFDSNLLSLKILEKKKFQFVGKQGFLYLIDNEKDKVL